MEKNNKNFRIAVDIGGTFIDALIFDFKAGSLKIVKVPTTPKNPHEGVISGVELLSKTLHSLDEFVHGTKLGLNAILERKGFTRFISNRLPDSIICEFDPLSSQGNFGGK